MIKRVKWLVIAAAFMLTCSGAGSSAVATTEDPVNSPGITVTSRSPFPQEWSTNAGWKASASGSYPNAVTSYTSCVPFPITDTVTGPQLLYSNTSRMAWLGLNSLTIRATLAYGDAAYENHYKVLFGGKPSISLNPGDVAWSDPIGLTLWVGTTCQVWTEISVANGQIVPGQENHDHLPLENGAMNSYYSGTLGTNTQPRVDLPSGSAFTSDSRTYHDGMSDNLNVPTGDTAALDGPYTCMSICGHPAVPRPRIVILGDSICNIDSSKLGGAWWDQLLKCSQGMYAVQNLAGDTTCGGANWISNTNTQVIQVLQAGGERFSHCIWAYGRNDLYYRATDTQLKQACTAYWTQLSQMGTQVYATTITPYTTSTDSFQTLANQTIVGGIGPTSQEHYRVAYNTWLRGLTYPSNGLTGYIDTAAAVESSLNSGLWKVNHTSDGLHPSASGIALMAGATICNAAYPSGSTTLSALGLHGYSSIAMVKTHRADDKVSLPNSVVTAAFSDGSYYVEATDRGCGIRVSGGAQPKLGDLVQVAGSLSLNDGEVQVNASTCVTVGQDSVNPIGIPARLLGGGLLGLQAGVAGAPRPNNFGLLVRVWGKVTEIGSGCLYLDDGSNWIDGNPGGESGHAGVNVLCDPSGYKPGDILLVTGINSCFTTSGGQILPRILTRGTGDVKRY